MHQYGINSLQAKLTIAFLIMALAIIVTVVWFNNSTRSLAETTADDNLLTNAIFTANQIDEFNTRNLQSFQIASALPTFNTFLTASADEQADTDLQEQVRDTLSTLGVRPWSQYYVLSYALLDLDGINLMDTVGTNIGNDESEREYFTDPIQNGLAYISTVEFESRLGGAFFYYSVPIRLSEPPNTVVGVLRAQLSVATIQSLIYSTHADHSDTHIFLVDENYIRLADNQNSALEFRSLQAYSQQDAQILRDVLQLPPLTTSELNQPLPNLATALTASANPQLVTGYTMPNSETEQRIGIVPLQTQPWYLVYSRPIPAFYAPVQQQSQGILLISSILVIIAVSGAVFFARLITRPILELTKVAEEASYGNLDVKADIHTGDEIGRLAQTFNAMTDELKVVNATLEDRVERRTEELKKANEALQHEIEERQRLEAEKLAYTLEAERSRILADFIQNVSHEFKTPLSVINVQSHLIKRISDEDPITARVEKIVAQSKNIETLVNDMVLLTRLDGDITPIEASNIELNSFIRSIIISDQVQLEQANMNLVTELDDSQIMIKANGSILGMALSAIMDNAMQFTPEGGTITLKTGIVDGQAQITIADTGVGIAPNDLQRVLERFYRVDPARTMRGFGLGLPIAKKAIDRFDGKLYISSTVGKGTTVRVRFPVLDTP